MDTQEKTIRNTITNSISWNESNQHLKQLDKKPIDECTQKKKSTDISDGDFPA